MLVLTLIDEIKKCLQMCLNLAYWFNNFAINKRTNY